MSCPGQRLVLALGSASNQEYRIAGFFRVQIFVKSHLDVIFVVI